MITFNSNCSRVDMVKAQANQIKTQFGGSSGTEKSDPPARKVKSDLQTLDTQIKSGDANKAEVAFVKVTHGGDEADLPAFAPPPFGEALHGGNRRNNLHGQKVCGQKGCLSTQITERERDGPGGKFVL